MYEMTQAQLVATPQLMQLKQHLLRQEYEAWTRCRSCSIPPTRGLS